MHDYLLTTPFDLYELHLFHLVVKYRSFTRAAQRAGLTQSAMTRRIQGIEQSLGLTLLERTTRTVKTTAAGQFLFDESAKLVGGVDHLFQRLREEFAGARREVRVGVSRTVSLAYLPGFFHANLRRSPEMAIRVVCDSSDAIVDSIEANELDVGVICPDKQATKRLLVTHQFEDAFTLIAPPAWVPGFENASKKGKEMLDWLKAQNWLLLDERSDTGQQLRTWMAKEGIGIEPVMQLDGFDLIINLVSLGMGISVVPIRALALYGNRRPAARVGFPARFVRQLAVVIRKQGKVPHHVTTFVEQVLF